MTKPFYALRWLENALVILDQRALPHSIHYLTCTNYRDVIAAIQSMAIRGAPAIALAGAYGVALFLHEKGASITLDDINGVIKELRESRPTAVNLGWALDLIAHTVHEHYPARELPEIVLQRAHELFDDDIRTNRAIAENGNTIIPQRAAVIHHCNTGSLATADYGTALGVIRYAHEQGKDVHVYLDETRPRLQGSILSAFELRAHAISHTVIVDSAAATVMRTRHIDLCIVGCDRVVRNGDVANKIGTYALAVAASVHNVPFYVACPRSSIDFETATGDEIIIEERTPDEITHCNGTPLCLHDTPVWNPAFDVTPHHLITGYITEKGIVTPPFLER